MAKYFDDRHVPIVDARRGQRIASGIGEGPRRRGDVLRIGIVGEIRDGRRRSCSSARWRRVPVPGIPVGFTIVRSWSRSLFRLASMPPCGVTISGDSTM